MVLRKIMGLFVCVLVLSSAALAIAGIPDPFETTASFPDGYNNETIVLFNLPDGSGSPFTNAQVFNDGAPIDATISMIVRDSGGVPVENLPRDDMWLISLDGGMIPCVGGTIADFSTNSLGETEWSNPLDAGSWSLGFTQISINGILLNQGPLALHFNSADIDGNGQVTLPDVTTFSGHFYGAYHFKADFAADGILTLPDVTRLAEGLGTSCP